MTQHDDARPSVAIIGAGWAGLACALTLARAGLKPVVFEAAPEPGGRARRANLDGAWRDNGQHLMLSGCQALLQLFNELGLNLPVVPFAYHDGVRSLSLARCRGRWGLLRALLTARGFTWPERLSLLRALLGLQQHAWQAPHDQTVLQWLHAQQQPASLIQHFWAPLALAILNTPMKDAAMCRLAAVLRDTMGAGCASLGILQPSRNLSECVVTPLISAIEAAGGRVVCGRRVTAVRVTAAGGYALTLQHNAGPIIVDQVVLAVPPWALPHIDLPWAGTALAERFGAQPIATVYLGFDATVQLSTPLVQLTGPTPEDACVWAMDRRHCGEAGVIAVSLSAAGPWTTLDAATLAEACIANLQAVGLHAPCRWHRVVTVQRATPAATPMARLAPHESRPRPGLYLAGDWTHADYPATLEAAVRSGRDTAQQILAERRT